MPKLERRELLGSALALTLVPSFHILNALAEDKAVSLALQTPEEMNFVHPQTQRAMENTENWIAMHAEHCFNRIIWNGPITEWTEQLHQKIDYFADLALGKDGGPGILLSRAQMDLIAWQTRAYSGASPSEARLFVSTLFLIAMTVSYYDTADQGIHSTYAETVKSKYPSLHESIVAALRVLNAGEVCKYTNELIDMEGPLFDTSELLSANLKAVAPAVKYFILSLLHLSTSPQPSDSRAITSATLSRPA